MYYFLYYNLPSLPGELLYLRDIGQGLENLQREPRWSKLLNAMSVLDMNNLLTFNL
ncbi:POTRA domain-containing protein [Yersinia sp. 2544 StPb PI]|uniref:POTRA domain-containing protein n=1 Tax=unclassified Yersinia (in: enterobacteria) TaxID=2653513 RepID=UPI00187D4120